MRNQLLILGLVLLGFGTTASGQNFPGANTQLYVIKADGKTLITDSNGVAVKEVNPNSDSQVYLNPGWIDSMEVVKGKNATDKFGPSGQNGVIIVTLKKDGFSKMRQQDQEKFKKVE